MSKRKKLSNFFVTKNYGQFKKTKGNRPINPSHVDRIKKAIAVRDLKFPIFVTKNMEIREGHHTFQARKELGLPIYYIVMESNDAYDMALLNSNRSQWSLEDYLNFYCTYQKKDYLILRSKIKEYNLPVVEAVSLFHNRVGLDINSQIDYKEGNFKIPPGGIARFDRIVSEMKYINDLIFDSKKMKRGFIRAYVVADRCPKWDFNRFKAAMKSKGARLLGAQTTEDYISQFDKIYNAGLVASKKIKLARFFEDKDFLEQPSSLH